MSDEIWKRDEVASPCVRVCVVDPASRLCMGCYRTVEEIAGWSAMDDAARRTLLAELPGRAERVRPRRRGGRAGRAERKVRDEP